MHVLELGTLVFVHDILCQMHHHSTRPCGVDLLVVVAREKTAVIRERKSCRGWVFFLPGKKVAAILRPVLRAYLSDTAASVGQDGQPAERRPHAVFFAHVVRACAKAFFAAYAQVSRIHQIAEKFPACFHACNKCRGVYAGKIMNKKTPRPTLPVGTS